jgi:hypothetical protein
VTLRSPQIPHGLTRAASVGEPENIRMNCGTANFKLQRK